MTVPTLGTERLTLRAPQVRDARVVTKALNNLNVSRWLTVVPFPYGLTDAQWFINECKRGHITAWFIWAKDRFVGAIGLDDSLGYWLAEDAWGNGYATEAGRAVLDYHFAHTDDDFVRSSHFDGNTGSHNVLIKLGFADTGPSTAYCKALDQEVGMRGMILHRDQWQTT